MVRDMYFVHQRGLRVALFSLVIGTIGNGTAIVAGVITTNMGWHWLFILLAIFAGVQFVAMFFLCPETTYVRLDSHQIGQVNQLGRTVTLEQTELEFIDKFGKKHLHTVASIPKHYEESLSRITTRTIPRKKSYGQSLAIWNSKFTDESLISHVIAPFMTVFNPGALYILVSSAFMIASFVAVSFILAAVFSAPPYLFTAAQVGYLSIGPTIGGLLGTIFMGLIDEPMVKYFTKRNHGI
jgi:MFS family permease